MPEIHVCLTGSATLTAIDMFLRVAFFNFQNSWNADTITYHHVSMFMCLQYTSKLIYFTYIYIYNMYLYIYIYVFIYLYVCTVSTQHSITAQKQQSWFQHMFGNLLKH